METCLEAARSYVARGWAVLPIHGVVAGACTCPAKSGCTRGAGKHPLTARGLKDASRDLEVIERWWSQWPWANVAVATGAVSGVWVVDIDPRHGGGESWNTYEVETNYDPPPATREVSTGGGGRHLYYRSPAGTGESVSSRNGLMPGVDIKSDGGYVLAPPSRHLSGGEYLWANNTRIVFASEDLLQVIDRGGWGSGVVGSGGVLRPLGELLRVGIPEGQRDETVFRALRREAEACQGDQRVLLEVGRQLAAACVPPFPEDEMRAKVDQAIKYYWHDTLQRANSPQLNWPQLLEESNGRAAGALAHATAEAVRYPGYGDNTEDGLAQRLTWWLNVNGELTARFTDGVGWFVWDEERGVWAADSGDRRISRKVMGLQNLVGMEAAAAEEEKGREGALRARGRVKSAAGIAAVVKVAEFLEEFSAGVDDWDPDPWLLNCANGCVDLRTGELRASRPGDLCTQQSPVRYEAGGAGGCAEWLKFLGWVVPDEEERGWLQRAVGYSLTGDTGAKAFFMLTGSGNNGKSTFLETVAGLAGGYAGVAMKSLFIKRFNESHPEAVARLQGRRFVHSSEEVGPADSLNTEVLKTLTGGDRVVARFMNKGSFEFEWKAKLWLATNHVPAVTEWGEALSGRMRLLAFEAVPVGERRPLGEVKAMFRAEMSGVLSWAVEGARAVAEMGVSRGLAPVGGMAEEADVLFSGQDAARAWFEERWEVDLGARGETIGDLWEDFCLYLALMGEDPGGVRVPSRGILGSRLSGMLPKSVKFKANREGHRAVAYKIRRTN